jgi:predicted nucleotidyltransferase
MFDIASFDTVRKHTERQGKKVFQDSSSSSSEIRKMHLSKVFVFCVDTPCVLVDM